MLDENRAAFGSGRARTIALAVALTASGVGFVALDPRGAGLFSGDCAIRLIQTRLMLREGPFDSAYPYPGRAIDPELRFVPLRPPFVYAEEGAIRFSFPPMFPLLCAAFVRLGGSELWALAPGILALASIAFAVERVGRAAGMRRSARGFAGIAVAACSPLPVYAVGLWEHVPAAALALFGIAGAFAATRGGRGGGRGAFRVALSAGAAAGLAIGFREEAAAVAGSLAAWLAFRAVAGGKRGNGRAATGFVSGIALGGVAVFLVDRLAGGGGFGLRWIEAAGAGGSLAERAGRLARTVAPAIAHVPLVAIAPAVAIVGAASGRRAANAPGRSRFVAGRARVLFAIGATGAIAASLAAPNAGGVQWGPRYWLVAFPALLLAAVAWADALPAGRARSAAWALMWGAAAWGGGRAIEGLAVASRRAENEFHWVEYGLERLAGDAPIVFLNPYVAQAAPGALLDRLAFLATTPDEYFAIERRLAGAGFDRIALADWSPASPGFAAIERDPRWADAPPLAVFGEASARTSGGAGGVVPLAVRMVKLGETGSGAEDVSGP